LAEAVIGLPGSVVVLATDPGGDLADTNQGVLFKATTAVGWTIYLPKQPPINVGMAALMEGMLLELNGCLRLSDERYADDYHYFDNKVSCSGPFWGVNSVDVIPQNGPPRSQGCHFRLESITSSTESWPRPKHTQPSYCSELVRAVTSHQTRHPA
jgi:hypothetical protein